MNKHICCCCGTQRQLLYNEELDCYLCKKCIVQELENLKIEIDQLCSELESWQSILQREC